MRRTLSTSLVAALVAVCVAALAGAQSASYYFAIAKMYAAEGSYREAVEAFTRAVALEPEDPYIRMEYAELLSRTGRSRQAAEVAGQALELAPLNPDALRLVGEIRLELAPRDARSLRLARDAFEKLRDIDPADTPSLLTLARIYLSQNNAAGALETLEVASSYNPNHPAVHRALLEAVASSGDDDKALELLPGILQRDPGFLAGRLALARVHSERGDHGAAVSVLDAAPPDDGANPDAMYLLASELFRRAARGSQARAGATDDLERAAGLVNGILDEQPTHLEAQYLRGLIVAEQGDLEAAIGGLETLYEVAPQDLRLRIGSKLSQLLEGEGRVAEAAALLSDLAQEQKQTGTRDVMADRVLLQVARLHQRHQEWQELEAAAEKLMEASETALRLEGALLMAEALHEGGDSRAALQHLRRRSADFDDPTRLQLRRAEILDEMGNRGEADRTLARLVESGEVPALLAVAQFHLERGNEAEVVPVLELLLAQPKDSVDAGMHREIVYLLSDSLITLERGEDALAVLSSAAGANSIEGANLDQRRLQLKRAEILETLDRGEEAAAIVAGIAESPDRSAALLLVNYYQRQTRFEAMIPILRDALDATPSADEAALDVDLYFSLGMAYERTGKFSEADEAFREVLTREPEDDRTLNYLGYMWAERGERLDEALSLIERAVAIEPDNPAYVDSLGWAHYRLGNYDRARDSLEYAARLLPEDATILLHLGDLYVALEFPEKARELYRRAVARNDENVEGVRRKLSELGLGGS